MRRCKFTLWNDVSATTIALAAGAVLAGCGGATEQESRAADELAVGDESSEYERDLAFFAARRERFERAGVVPLVPPSLSADSGDPRFVFLGYMPIATPDEQRVDDERRLLQPEPPMTTEERDSLKSERLDPDEIRLVNGSGEQWAYRPVDLEARLARRRALAGNVETRSTRASVVELSVKPAELGVSRATGFYSQKILGDDNRILRSKENGFSMTSYPWRAIGALVADGTATGSTPPVSCSATKIGERHLLTAGHCVFTAGAGKSSLKKRDWWPGADGLDKTQNGGDPTPNSFKNIQWYVYSKHFVNDGWGSRDYSVLVLYDNQNSCNFGWFGYRTDDTLTLSSMWNFGYPGTSKSCSASTRPDGKCGGSMYGMSEVITRTEIPYIFYKHDQQEGQSGAAVYDYNGGNRQLVGFMKSEYTSIENRGIKIRSLLFDFMESARDDHPSSFCD